MEGTAVRTPTAVLIGFAMLALAVAFGPLARDFIVTPAYAQWDAQDHLMFRTGLNEIARAIQAVGKCR